MNRKELTTLFPTLSQYRVNSRGELVKGNSRQPTPMRYIIADLEHMHPEQMKSPDGQYLAKLTEAEFIDVLSGKYEDKLVGQFTEDAKQALGADGTIRRLALPNSEGRTVYFDVEADEIIGHYDDKQLSNIPEVWAVVQALTAPVKHTEFDPYSRRKRLLWGDEPGLPEHLRGITSLNTFRGIPVQDHPNSPKQEPEVVTKFLNHLFTTEESAHYFRCWLRHAIWFGRNETAFTMIAAKGLGKNTLFECLIAPVLGPHYTSQADKHTLTNQFNSEFREKLVVLFDEVELGAEAIQAFKRMSNSKIQIESKGKDPLYLDNYASMILFANEAELIRVESDDRRFSIPETGKITLPERCREWGCSVHNFKQELKFAAMDFATYLRDHFDPKGWETHQPLRSASFWRAVEANQPEWVQVLTQEAKTNPGSELTFSTFKSMLSAMKVEHNNKTFNRKKFIKQVEAWDWDFRLEPGSSDIVVVMGEIQHVKY